MSYLTRAVLFIICLIIALDAAVAQELRPPAGDAQILRVVSAIDQNEGKIADLAQAKNINPAVMGYAKLIQIDHQMNLDWDRELSRRLGDVSDEDTPLIAQWQNFGRNSLIKLGPLDRDDFSREFIWELIRSYSDALNWIYSQAPEDKQIKVFLEDTKQRLMLHLKKAQQLREEVLDNPG